MTWGHVARGGVASTRGLCPLQCRWLGRGSEKRKMDSPGSFTYLLTGTFQNLPGVTWLAVRGVCVHMRVCVHRLVPTCEVFTIGHVLPSHIGAL